MFAEKKIKPVNQSSFLMDKENPSFIQSKLKMGKAGDKYEVEADQMADKVVRKKDSEEEVQQKPLASNITPVVQLMESSEDEQVQAKCSNCEKEEQVQKVEKEEPLQMQEKNGEEEESLQMQEEEEVQTKKNNNKTTGNSIEGKLKNESGGFKLESSIKNEMESGFGTDFSRVNIHTDSEAIQMSQNIGAQAFTHGNDVYFNKGKYNPNSKEGKHLLAHELTHTVQQKGKVSKNIQQQAANYTCSGNAFRGATASVFKINGATDAPDGTRVNFHYLRGAGCSSMAKDVPSFAMAVVAGGKFKFRGSSLLTTMPPIGAQFIAVIGNSHCCIRVAPIR